MDIFFSIGNSDNKLDQMEWHNFNVEVRDFLRDSHGMVEAIHGEWFSPSDAWVQNACYCVEVCSFDEDSFKEWLSSLCKKHGQESIAYLSGVTEFIG